MSLSNTVGEERGELFLHLNLKYVKRNTFIPRWVLDVNSLDTYLKMHVRRIHNIVIVILIYISWP